MNGKPSTPVKIFFDGSSRPNPGPIETAVVLRGTAEIRRGHRRGTSHMAEWFALLDAIELAARHGERDIILLGDSRCVIRQAAGTDPCRSALARTMLARYREALPHFDRIRLRHLRRSHNLAGIALERAHHGR